MVFIIHCCFFQIWLIIKFEAVFFQKNILDTYAYRQWIFLSHYSNVQTFGIHSNCWYFTMWRCFSYLFSFSFDFSVIRSAFRQHLFIFLYLARFTVLWPTFQKFYVVCLLSIFFRYVCSISRIFSHSNMFKFSLISYF